MLNILQDSNAEKLKLEDAQRAALNILQDSNAEKLKLADTQKALLNIMQDFNQINEELKKAHDVLEARVEERTAALEQSLREKEVLLREIHHRVKNNLQIIHSMLNLQLPQVTDQKAVELFKESQNQVYSMALIHEKLYQSESMARVDFPEYIRSLVSYLFISYGVVGNAIRPAISVEDVSLDIDSAIPCALIINELVSNSLKHAFPASRRLGSNGRVEVSLRHDTGTLLLTVSDNGVGLPQDFEIGKSQSLGLKLVNVLVTQLRGTLDITSKEGAKFIISFAARNVEGG